MWVSCGLWSYGTTVNWLQQNSPGLIAPVQFGRRNAERHCEEQYLDGTVLAASGVFIQQKIKDLMI